MIQSATPNKPSDPIVDLYNALSSNPSLTGLPDIETFRRQLIEDPSSRRQLYDALKANPTITGLPDYRQFDSTMTAGQAPSSPQQLADSLKNPLLDALGSQMQTSQQEVEHSDQLAYNLLQMGMQPAPPDAVAAADSQQHLQPDPNQADQGFKDPLLFGGGPGIAPADTFNPTSQEKQDYQQEKLDEQQAKENQPLERWAPGEGVAGLMRGVLDIPKYALEFQAAFGPDKTEVDAIRTATGLPQPTKEWAKNAADKLTKIQQENSWLKESDDIKGKDIVWAAENAYKNPSKSWRWIVSKVSETTPSMLPSMAATAWFGAGTGLKALGQFGVAFFTSIPMEVGSQLADLRQTAEAQGRKPTTGEYALAIASGVGASVFEGLGEVTLLKRIMKGFSKSPLSEEAKDVVGKEVAKSVTDYWTKGMKQVGKEAGKSFLTEGTTEAIQQGIENAGAKLGWDPSREITDGMVEAGVIGGIAGGGMTTTAGAAGVSYNTLQLKSQLDQAFAHAREQDQAGADQGPATPPTPPPNNGQPAPNVEPNQQPQEQQDTGQISPEPKTYASSKKKADREGGTYQEINLHDIDLEASGLKDLDPEQIGKVQLLKVRGRNADGQVVGQVRITSKNGIQTFEVKFNEDSIQKRPTEESQPPETPGMDRTRFLQKIKESGKLTDAQVGSLMDLVDARAEAWASINDRDPADWYKEKIGDIVTDQQDAKAELLQEKAAGKPFYSKMERVLEDQLPGKVNPRQLQKLVDTWQEKGQFRADEVKWSGIQQWASRQKGKLTKQQVLDYVRSNQLRVEEVPVTDPKYREWSTPGKNYGELLFKWANRRQMMQNMGNDYAPASDPHFKGQEDILAHVRYDQVEEGGKKILRLQEIQGDLASPGQDAPFTRNAHELVMKRMLRWAAEHGYDALQWQGGDLQNARYDLPIEANAAEVTYLSDSGKYKVRIFDDFSGRGTTKIMSEEELYNEFEDYEINTIEDAPDNTPVYLPDHWTNLSGEKLPLIYDKLIPQFMDKYVKAWDAKVDAKNVQQKPTHDDAPIETTVWTVPITQSMKDAVLFEGQPLWQEGRASEPKKSQITHKPPAGLEANEERRRYENWKDANEYESATGEKIRSVSAQQLGLFDQAAESDVSGRKQEGDTSPQGADNSRSRRKKLIEKRKKHPTFRKPRPGEILNIEVKYRAYKGIQLFGRSTKVESVEDVAWLFRALETSSVEHLFAAFVRADGSYVVQHMTTGAYTASLAPVEVILDGVNRFEAQKVFLIHNHPSGNLKSSEADRHMYKTLVRSMPEGVQVGPGIVINLDSGEYLEFEEDGYKDQRKSFLDKKDERVPVKAIQFSKQKIHHSTLNQQTHSSPGQIARFITQNKLSANNKMYAIVLNAAKRINGAFMIDTPLSQPQKFRDELLAITSRLGAKEVVLATNMTADQMHENRDHIKAVLDLSNNYRRHERIPFPLDILDMVGVETGRDIMMSYDSAREEGIIKEDRLEYGAQSLAEETGIQYVAEPERGPVFYSKLQRTIEQKMGGKMTVSQLRDTLRSWSEKGEFKTEELQWSFLDEWLDAWPQDAKITRDAVLNYLFFNKYQFLQHEVQGGLTDAEVDRMLKLKDLVENGGATLDEKIEFRQLQERDDVYEDEQARYHTWKLDGGKYYQVHLLTYKPLSKSSQFHIAGPYSDFIAHNIYEARRIVGDLLKKYNPEQISISLTKGAPTYFTAHFDEKNIIIHFRTTERTDSEGRKVFFVEEIQSDWHQTGRAHGYKNAKDQRIIALQRSINRKMEKVDTLFRHYYTESRDLRNKYLEELNPQVIEELNRANAEVIRLKKRIAQLRDMQNRVSRLHVEGPAYRPPAAPWSTAWPELAVKKIMRLAVESGADYIGWTTGAQQNKRYDLRKRVSKIGYFREFGTPDRFAIKIVDVEDTVIHSQRNMTPEELADYLGKEITKNITDDAGRPTDSRYKYLEGNDLEIGGEDMIAFYDKMLPSIFRKLSKKFGTQYQPIDLTRTVRLSDYEIQASYDLGFNSNFLAVPANQAGNIKAGRFYNYLTEEGRKAIKNPSLVKYDIRKYALEVRHFPAIKLSPEDFYQLAHSTWEFDSSNGLKLVANHDIDGSWKILDTEDLKRIRKEGLHGTMDVYLMGPGRSYYNVPEDLLSLDEATDYMRMGRPIHYVMPDGQMGNLTDLQDLRKLLSTSPDRPLFYKGVIDQEGEVKTVTHSISVTPKMRQSLLANPQPLFQEQESVKKGGVDFMPDGRAIIYLFEHADFSTLVHEIGHIFRRDLSAADLATAEKWAGVKNGNWTVEAEEKFARGFERYLRDGKAPTSKLQQVFDRFRTWLKKIYQRLRGSAIDVKLNADIRRVFDHLFTGEAPAVDPKEVYTTQDGNYDITWGKDGIQLVNTKTGQEIGRTSKKFNTALAEYLNSDHVMSRRPVLQMDEYVDDLMSYIEEVSNYSKNPAEIVEALDMLQHFDEMTEQDTDTMTLEQFFADGGKLRPEDVRHFDYSAMDDPTVRLHTSADALAIDARAQELSTLAGYEISPEQVVEYLLERIQRQSERGLLAETLKNDFFQMTGHSLTDNLQAAILQAMPQLQGQQEGSGIDLAELNDLLSEYQDEQGNLDLQRIWDEMLSEDQRKEFFMEFPLSLTEKQYLAFKNEVQHAIQTNSEFNPTQPSADLQGAGTDATTAPADRPGQDGGQQEEVDLEDGADYGAGIDAAPFSPKGVPNDPLTGKPPYNAATIAGSYMRLHTEPQSWFKGKLVSSKQVIDALAGILKAAGKDIPMRYGRMGNSARWGQGFFKVHSEIIRTKKSEDIPVLTHEVAHALEKAVYGWEKLGPWRKPRVSQQMQAELLKLGKFLYGDRQPVGGYKREGFAEFFSYYLLTDMAKKKAPTFYDWFTQDFLKSNPKIEKAVANARQAIDQYSGQGSVNRAKANIKFKTSALEKIKAALRREAISKNWWDQQTSLNKIVQQAEAITGKKFKPSENPWFIASALRMTNAARARYFAEHAAIDVAGNKVGPGLKEIMSIVGPHRDEFTLYLWARRALKLWTPSERWPAGRNPGLAKEDAEYIVNQYDSREFQLAAGKLYEWSNNVLRYGSKAFGSDFVERIIENDVGDYLPLQRVFDDLDQMVLQGGYSSGRVLGADPVKALKGSNRRIRDPLQVMIESADQYILKTHQRMTLNALLRMRHIEGMGRFIEEVPRSMVPHSYTVERIIDELNRNDIMVDFYGAMPDDLSGQWVTFFTPAIVPTGGKDPVFAAWEDGKVKWFQVPADLYSMMTGLDVYRAEQGTHLNWIKYFGVKSARAFRMGTTGLRAAFSLMTNPLRDVQTFVGQSKTNARPHQMALAWMASMGNALTANLMGDVPIIGNTVKSITGKDLGNIENYPYLDYFYAIGAEMSQPLNYDSDQVRRAVRGLFPTKKWRVLQHPIDTSRDFVDALRDFLQAPETATRVAELRLKAKEIGWKPGEPITLDQALELKAAVSQVTVDFTDGGIAAKKINQYIPFFNVQFLGPKYFLRAFKDHPARAILTGMTMALTTLGWWWFNLKDEDWWKDMPWRYKFSYWFIPAGDEVIMIPRSQEWGYLFGTVPEILFNSWYEKDPEGAGQMMEFMLSTHNPVDLPPIFKTGAEELANRVFYFDQPIVPKGEQQRPAEEQFGPYQSKAAIWLGQQFGISPRRIEHSIRGLFGGLGKDVIDLADLIGGHSQETPRDTEPSDWPVIGRLFRSGGAEGTSSIAVNKFYEARNQALQRMASVRHPETEGERQKRLMLEDASRAISALNYVQSYTEKQSDRQAIQRQIREMARQALADIGQPVYGRQRGKWQRQKLNWTRVKEKIEKQLEDVNKQKDNR